jgi:hypothetical protein
MTKSRLSDCKIIELPKILDKKANLTFIEENKDVPFKIKRVYYIYGVPKGEKRGRHAMGKSEEVIIALNGSFDVILDDGIKRKTFRLNRPYYGLFIPAMIWQELDFFSSTSICLVLSSEFYNNKEYIKDYNKFRQMKLQKQRVVKKCH